MGRSFKCRLSWRHPPEAVSWRHAGGLAEQRPADAIVAWRVVRLCAAGLDSRLALTVAEDRAYDLHALLELVDRGCRADLAARILAPLEDPNLP
jgi:alkylhydroperoxidase family enzyme